MSAYAKLAREELEDVENEILESQIEELNNLQYYDYYLKSITQYLCCTNVEGYNKRVNVIEKINEKIEDEWRCLFYCVLLPFIIIYWIFKGIINVLKVFLQRPNGHNKRMI